MRSIAEHALYDKDIDTSLAAATCSYTRILETQSASNAMRIERFSSRARADFRGEIQGRHSGT